MQPVIAVLAMVGSLQAAWIFAAATPAGATGAVTYYVNAASGSSPSSADAAGKASDAFSTVAGALRCAYGDSTTPSTPDTIDIAAGTYDEHDMVLANVNLVGAGASSTAIDGTDSGTVLTLGNDTVRVSGLTIEDGSNAFGAGISSENGATLIAAYDTFSGNSASEYGGGIENVSPSSLTAANDTFSGNSAGGSGAGIFDDSGSATTTDDTFSGNSAIQNGGGIYNDSGSMVTNDDTLSGNSADTGGGISTTGAITLSDTVLANNTGGDCNGAVADGGYNVDDDGTCGFSSENGSLSDNADADLGPLQDNGGPTQTMAIGPSSSAFELVPATACTQGTDQIGNPRPGIPAANCDAGAYEYQGFTVTFAANGATGTMAPETADSPTALSANSFTWAGYNFEGWNTAPDGSGASYVDGATYPFTANATLYAVWSASTPAPPPPTTPSSGHGYWLAGSDGGVFAFGSARFYGSARNLTLDEPVVGSVPTADRRGYWLNAADGGVFAYGDAPFYGSIPGLGISPAGSGQRHSLNAPIVGMVPSTDGGGYFMVASDGGVFAFGDAKFKARARASVDAREPR